MVAVVLVVLVQNNPSPLLALPAAVIIGREITVSALREWMAELGARGKVAVSSLGKIKTTAQMLALIMLIYQHPIGHIPIYSVGFILLYVAALLTFWSMCRYLWAAWPRLSGKD
jgi:CDP-diacylglycerol--glycerol-3-phosphate 3-phosphatidyltransferase/cardiolipin synthase